MFDLENKVAIVTGGNGGLGLAMAKGLIAAGARVAIWGRNHVKNKNALEILGDKAAAFVCDVSKEEECINAFKSTISTFGQVDFCFANAGGSGRQGHFTSNTLNDWKDILDLNLISVINTFKPVIAHLLERKVPGKLVVTSSVAGLMGMAYAAGYGTTKAAVLGLVRSLAIELGRNNIQVNAILPGYIETEMSIETPQTFKDAVIRRSATGKTGNLEQMEGVAVFLASKYSDFMTGQAMILDGGHTIHPM